MSALSQFTMLDLTHMLSGPYGTMLLTDLGMNTIKVEPPGTGEGTRRLLSATPEYSRDGMGAYFLTLNRSKKSVSIDLKNLEGRELFYDMVRKADVVFDNFAVGVTQRLCIDYESLAAINPAIITCSVTGFGTDGPGARRPAFDLVAQASGGGMSLTGLPGGEPLRSGIPIGDLGGGLFGAIGVLSALHERTQTGRGQMVDISMLDCQISMLNYMATMQLLSGNGPSATGNGHFVHVPYNAFPTKTLHLIIAVISDNKWPPFVDALGNDKLCSPEFHRQPERLKAREFIESEIVASLAEHDVNHWLEVFEKAGVPCAPVNGLAEAVNDAQVRHRHMIVDVPLPGGGSFQAPGNPIKLSNSLDTSDEAHGAPPELGQHTDSVLQELLGMPPEEVASLRSAGVVQ